MKKIELNTISNETLDNIKDNLPNQILIFLNSKRLTVTRGFLSLLFLWLVMHPEILNNLSGCSTTGNIIGSPVVLTGLLFRSWSAGLVRKNKHLETTGPYSLIRHPLYLGSFLMIIGFLLILKHWYIGITVLVVTAFIYIPAIIYEESRLASKFGEKWDDYSQRVGVLYPKNLNRELIQANWSAKQWLRNREYEAFLTALFALLLFNFLVPVL